MKAAVLREINTPLEIEDIQHGDPTPREVLVRTVAAGVCHSDLHFQNGSYPYPLPAVLGHESAGIVEAVGSDVTYVKPGDHVITCLSAFAVIASTVSPVICRCARNPNCNARRINLNGSAKAKKASGNFSICPLSLSTCSCTSTLSPRFAKTCPSTARH